MSLWCEVDITAPSGASIECQVLTAEIHHGRDDPTTQPAPCTVVMELVGALPPQAVIGARVIVYALIELPKVYRVQRFQGEITDLGVGWDLGDTDTVGKPRIIATGFSGRIGRRMVGESPWPAELEGTRVNRILTASGYPPSPYDTDPGTVTLLARDVDRQPALAMAHEAASDGGGIVWEDVRGRILYADALHRRSKGVVYTFDACDIGIGVTWQQSLEGVCNEVWVKYGSPAAEAYSTDVDSVTARGTFAASLQTKIASAADAQKRADDIVVRQSVPAWVFGGLETDLMLLPTSDAYSILSRIEVHELIKVVNLPDDGPTTEAFLWVEGWRETITPDSWLIAFATSDYCRSAGATPWDKFDAAITWNTVDPALTWNSAVCLPPSTAGGDAWDDADPAWRWDTVPSTISWDAWGTGP